MEYIGSSIYLGSYIYIVSAGLFNLSLKWMDSPATARPGVVGRGTGVALALVGTAEFYRANQVHETLPAFVMVALVIETLLRFLTFTGSLMAMGKLQEVLPQRPMTYKNQNAVNFTLFVIAAGLGVRLIMVPTDIWIFPIFAGLALV